MCVCDTGLCKSCKKKFVDQRLRACASLYANLGTESTDEEKQAAKDEEITLLEQIAEVDVEMSERLLNK